MRLLAIDPDPNGGSWVFVDQDGKLFGYAWRDSIDNIVETEMQWPFLRHTVVEDLQSYGMPVGASVFDTAKMIGEMRRGARVALLHFHLSLTRPKIKTALCGTPRAKDANVRAALIDLYGGSREIAIGRKATPGPLYGVSKDVWAALALAVVWLQTQKLGPLYERDRVQ